MTRILDIHTHHKAPQPEAVVAVSPAEFNPVAGQIYSVGIHPWHTMETVSDKEWQLLENACRHPQVAAIGECGIDLMKGGPMFRQIQVMKRQMDLSEELRKPLIIHDVKAHEVIIGMMKEYKPSQLWLVHGFRGKPSVARMLTDAGIMLSFGSKFNSETLLSIPSEMMLAETDDSGQDISQVVASLSASVGRDLTGELRHNASVFLQINDK